MPTINGTPGDDFLFGTPGDDDIHGFAGNDLVNAGDGNDLVEGGDGHDNLRGEVGNDWLYGQDGDDYLRGGPGDDLIDGGAGWDRIAFFTATHGIAVDLRIQGVAQNTLLGMDTLVGIEHASGTEFDDLIQGNDGDNWLWGENGNDTINAFGGNDLVEVGPGTVLADGGTGTDTFSVWANNAALAGVSVSLLLQGAAQTTGIGSMTIAGFENLSGSAGDDSLTGDGGVNVIAGDGGSDLLIGGLGNDTLYGDGRIIVDTHDTGLSGPITTYADIIAIDPLFVGGNDTLEGGAGDDALVGGGGNDTASFAGDAGAVFASLLSGFADDGFGDTDTLTGIENLTGSAFDDGLIGDNQSNILAGLGGHDFLRANGGNDTLKGGDGDDFLQGNLGDDILDGQNGFDRAAYSVGATAGVTVDLNIQGIAQNTGSQGFDTLISIEHVSGTIFNDVLTGNAGDNWIWGGSDTSGVTGNDILSGGGGNDLIEVGTGNHILDGGTGNDTLSLWGNDTDITAAGTTVSLALQGGAQATEQGSMTLTGFENLSGSIHQDFLTGDDEDNLLAGDRGGDTLSGGKGNDTLYGDGRVIVDTHGTGTSGPIVTYQDVANAPLSLASGNDVLDGGKGDDILLGGGGGDVLTGGQHSDVFVFGANDGDDRITDFSNHDTIRFEGIAGVDDFGDLTLTRIGSDTLITWGTGDSVLVEGLRPSQFHASDFSFG